MLLHHASELESDARSEAGRHRRSGGGGVLSLPRADIDFREDTQNRLRMLLDSHDLDVAFLYDLDLEPGLETSLNDARNRIRRARARPAEQVTEDDQRRENVWLGLSITLDQAPEDDRAGFLARPALVLGSQVDRRQFEEAIAAAADTSPLRVEELAPQA